MIEDSICMSHKLTLNGRKNLTLTGVKEVVSFDELQIVLQTDIGILNVHGQNLQLKTLSLEGGQVAVDGDIAALIYEETRQERKWRLFR